MVPKWSDTPLTQCPNNSGHSVVLDSEIIIQGARFTHHITQLFSTSSTSYVNVAKYVYQGTDYYDNDRVAYKYMKIRSSVVAGTYDLRLLDASSNVMWSSLGNTGSAEQIITFDFDTITPPTTEQLLTLQAKTSGSAVTIADVSLYSATLLE